MTKPLAHSYSALKQYDTCPKQYEMQRVTRVVKPSFGEASIHGQRIHGQLEARMRDKTPLPPESAKYEALCRSFEALPGTLLVEQEMTLNKELRPTGWWDADAWFRSKTDVLVLDKDYAVVGDWKTGKHRPDYTQLEMFALQVFKHYPEINRMKSAFVWLKDMRMDHQIYLRSEEPALWNRFLSRVQRIEGSLQADNWPAKPSGLCPWCPAKNLCEYANV